MAHSMSMRAVADAIPVPEGSDHRRTLPKVGHLVELPGAARTVSEDELHRRLGAVGLFPRPSGPQRGPSGPQGVGGATLSPQSGNHPTEACRRGVNNLQPTEPFCGQNGPSSRGDVPYSPAIGVDLEELRSAWIPLGASPATQDDLPADRSDRPLR